MSDTPTDPNVIDLRQATLAKLVDYLGELVKAINRSNDRFIHTNDEMAQLRQEMAGLRIETIRGFADLQGAVRVAHSETVSLEIQILNAIQKSQQNEVRLDQLAGDRKP